MLRFKTFIAEARDEDHDYESDFHDPAGPGALFAHYASLDDLDPSIRDHMHSNTGKENINEAVEEGPHKVLQKKMSGPASNPDAQSDVDNAVKSALKRHVEVYGREIGAPLTRSQSTEAGRKAVEEHYKKSPEEQHAALHAAASRIGHVAYGDKNMTPQQVSARLAGGNKKTDTVINNPIAKYKGKMTSSVSSYGAAPGAYTHFGDASGSSQHHVITCPHGTTGCMVGQSLAAAGGSNSKLGKVGPSCLAKSGGYGFKSTRKKVQINSHLRSGGSADGGDSTVADHAILTAHRLASEANKAQKLGSVHAVRTQTTDQRGEDIRAIANETARHVPSVGKNTVLFGYSKNPKEVLDAARATKNSGNVPEHIVHSHPGPAYHEDREGNLNLNQQNIRALKNLRNAHKNAKAEGLNVSDYVVTGGHSLDHNGEAVAGTVHRQPKSNAKAEESKRFSNVDSSVKHVRYWDLHHSGELHPGEPESHHDAKTGTGHTTIEQGGKRLKIKYYDRKANPGATSTGRTSYSQRHDARYSDAETGAAHSMVTAPVASTSNEATHASHANSMFHQMHVSHDMHGNKLRHSQAGMLHDAHPDLMQKAGYKYEDK